MRHFQKTTRCYIILFEQQLYFHLDFCGELVCVQEGTLWNDADILLGNRKFTLFNPWCSTHLSYCDSNRKQKYKLFSMFTLSTHMLLFTQFLLLEYNNEHFSAKVREMFTLCHTDPCYDTVFNGVMDWFKARRWSRLRIHNNHHFYITADQYHQGYMHSITQTLAYEHHKHTKGCFFSASPLLLLSLSITYYLSSSISPTASIPFEESWGNTGIQERGNIVIKTMFPQIPLLPPFLCMFYSLAAVCLQPVWSKGWGRKEWRGATAQSTRLQYKNEQRWTGRAGSGSANPQRAAQPDQYKCKI